MGRANYPMDVKASYRLLELEIGASRAEIEAAYFRMMERWHPDRVAPTAGPDAVQEAHRMVDQINDAYRTLDRIAPKPESPAPPAPPTGAPPTPSKPKIAPPLPEVITPAPKPKPPASTPTPTTPAPEPVAPAPEPTPPPAPEPETDFLQTTLASLDQMLPTDPKKRMGIIAGAAVALLLGLMLLVSTCSSKPTRKRSADTPDPATTGRLVVKSNRANATIEATRVPAAGETATAGVRGSPTGAAEQVMAGLPPGSYVLLTRSEGWPEMRQDVTLTAGQTTEVTVNFKTGSLRLDSIPGGAMVKFGDTVLGKTPLVVPQLPVGECTVSVEYPGWPAVPAKVAIAEGVETAQTVRLPHGRLIVESTPAGATVLMGGKPVGQTPATFERVSAGTWKVTVQAKDFTPVETPVTVEDAGEAKISPVLKSSLPILDPAATLTAIWLDTPIGRKNDLSPDFNQPINFRPKNGIVRNLNRKTLFENWLAKRFRYTGTVKSYKPETGIIEFSDENGENSKYMVTAQLTMSARNDKAIVAQLTKGATFALYGRLSAVEEPSWPAKVITFEITGAEPQR